MMEQIYSGSSPFNDGTELTTLSEPRESYPIPMAPERPEEFSPGLDPELQALADAFSAFKEKMVAPKKKSSIKKTGIRK
jgi:Mn-containing catalase